MRDLAVKLVESEADMEAAVGIRFRVFVDEQGVPPDIELDEYDAVSTHAIALLEGVAVGAGRMYLEDGSARIGRMAVDRQHRRGGVGGQILRFLEEEARSQGATSFTLHAQEYVKAFYAAHGYVEHGAAFMEAGISHIEMRKRVGGEFPVPKR